MGEIVDLEGMLKEIDESVRDEIASMPEVVDKGKTLDISELPIEARRWFKVSEVFAVVADLKGSTKLGTGKRASSTASIYQAGTGNVVKVFNQFEADFIAIQGDGAFALFWGDLNFERAMCAAVTVRTFSEKFSERLEKKWPDSPTTGFKVGVAEGRLLVKRVGTPRNPNEQEPVWAGKPVNYAAKAAQTAEREQVIVTGTVWDRIEKNDYLAISCGCPDGPSTGIWENTEIENLPEDEPEAQGRLLKAGWCDTHGDEFCNAIMSGLRKREGLDYLRAVVQRSQFESAIAAKARAARDLRNIGPR
ncbi:hypothetical protein HPO96_23235 [Kribbella sandramycini]|uniref:Class 3 adenylate cyclase n=1 Tax=Kribbella sandramycini TaxID=60450 RepID=A0A7Y4L2K3_9ACTN|nr:hypothetical protein [Kribbella sandramycini]MBB6566169.1 class 3 adenylate cyclase [Kribbella sandramycini]NOL43163.1 hypothetical protein [Kribbella sandramycini]